MFEDIVTLLMTHETKLEQHLHNSVEINSLDVNITTSNPNIITCFFYQEEDLQIQCLVEVPTIHSFLTMQEEDDQTFHHNMEEDA